jgi:aminoglycoside/choline kinase family phosphotransferase
VEIEPVSLPLGRAGLLQAVPLTNGDGDHAILLRQGEEPRALVTSEAADTIVLMPFDDRAELRADSDALATWVARGSLQSAASADALAGWATAIGLFFLLAILALAILGSLTFFAWLFASLGLGR